MVLLVKSKPQLEEMLKGAGSAVVVVDFYAAWCPPCKWIAPQLEALSREMPHVFFLKVDVDQSEEISAEFEIRAMPTFVFFKGGRKVSSFSGADYERIVQTIRSLE